MAQSALYDYSDSSRDVTAAVPVSMNAADVNAVVEDLRGCLARQRTAIERCDPRAPVLRLVDSGEYSAEFAFKRMMLVARRCLPEYVSFVLQKHCRKRYTLSPARLSDTASRLLCTGHAVVRLKP